MTKKQVVVLALPAVAEMMVHTLVGVIIVAIIGRLGAYAITTAGIGGQIVINAAFVLSAIGVGASVLVARAVGKNSYDETNYYFAKGLGLGIIIAVLWSCLFRFAIPIIIPLITIDDTLRVILTEYMSILAVPSGALMLLFILEFMVRGAGHTLVTLMVALFSGVINVAVSYVLIYGKFGFPELGVYGAAYGGVTAYVLAVIVMLVIILSNKLKVKILWREVFTPNISAYKRILKMGLPAAMDEGLWALNQWALLGILPALGAVQYAAHQIALSAEGVSFMPGYGFAIAAQVLVGQKLGAGLPEEAKKVAKDALLLALSIMLAVAAAFFFASTFFAQFYTDKAELVPLASTCIRIAAFEQPSIAVFMVFIGAFRGAGDTKWPLYLSIFAYWLIRVPMIYVAIKIFNLGITAFWYITVFQWAIVAIICIRRFRSNKWLSIEV